MISEKVGWFSVLVVHESREERGESERAQRVPSSLLCSQCGAEVPGGSECYRPCHTHSVKPNRLSLGGGKVGSDLKVDGIALFR